MLWCLTNWQQTAKQVTKLANVWQRKSSVIQQPMMLWSQNISLLKWVKKNLKNSLWLMILSNQCVTGKILNKMQTSTKKLCQRITPSLPLNSWTGKNYPSTISVTLMPLSGSSVISKTVQLLWPSNTWTHVGSVKLTTSKLLGTMLMSLIQYRSSVESWFSTVR